MVSYVMVKNEEGDDARLDWNCDVWRKVEGIKPGESMRVSKQGRMRQMTKELGAMQCGRGPEVRVGDVADMNGIT